MMGLSYNCKSCGRRMAPAPPDETGDIYVTTSSCQNVEVGTDLWILDGYFVLGAYCHSCDILLGCRVVEIQAGDEDRANLVGKYVLIKGKLARSDGKRCLATLLSRMTTSTSSPSSQ